MTGIRVNGRQRSLATTPVHESALDFLRGLGLTGAKEGCAEGECGACSVLVARPDGNATQWTALNACLVPALALDGQEVVTAEGLGEPHALHPVQREMAVRGGSQCGYCTPGFVCSMAAEYYRRDRTVTGSTTRGLAPRARRQPVPLHRLPADPGRSGGAGGAGRRRPARRPVHGTGTRARPDPDGGRARHVRAPGRPRGPRCARPRRPTPTRWCWPAPPTSASRPTCAARACGTVGRGRPPAPSSAR